MNPIITDLTSPPRKNKNIELISCLQHNYDPNNIGSNNFYKSNYSDALKRAEKITRLAALVAGYNNFDLIMVDDNVYLGYWNDGIVSK